jgi:hypothetical protein
MDLFYRFVIDAGLVVMLLFSTLIGNMLVSNCWKGLVGLHLLSFGAVQRISIEATIMMVVPSFLPVAISSYIYGFIVCVVNKEFNYSDIILVSICCFLGMFSIMGGGEIPGDLEVQDKYREQGYTSNLWWERIDESLTPAVIITLLIMSGLILSCYFNGLN